MVQGLQLSRRRVPVVASLDEPASRRSETRRKRIVGKDPGDAIREGRSVIGDEDVLSVADVEAFGSEARRDDGLGHRQSLDDLEPRAAPYPQRDDHHLRALEIRTNVGHLARDDHVGGSPPHDLRRRRWTNDEQPDLGTDPFDQGQHVVEEEDQPVN